MARLLIVEDDLDVREWVIHCMQQEQHAVVACESAAEALAQWESIGPDIDAVLLDYTLPGLDGVGLLHLLRETRPDLPAVFVTVQWSGHVIEQITATGAERVAKPFEPQALRDAIQRALAQSEGSRA